MSLKSLNSRISKAEDSFYIEKTTFLLQIPEKKLRKQLTDLYNSDNEIMRLLGSVINAMYTEGKTTFYLSKRSLERLIDNDKVNLEYKSRKGIVLGKGRVRLTYLRQDIIKEMRENGLFAILKEASQEDRTPSIIDMIDDELYELMDENNHVSKQCRKNWKQAALNTAEIISAKVNEDRKKPVATKTPKKAPIVVADETDVDLSIDEDDNNLRFEQMLQSISL